MREENETVADIVAEWRKCYTGMSDYKRMTMTFKTFRHMVLDRIEAAWKREREEILTEGGAQ